MYVYLFGDSPFLGIHVYLLILQPNTFWMVMILESRRKVRAFASANRQLQNLTLFCCLRLASLLFAEEPGDEAIGEGMGMTLCVCFFVMHSYQTQLLNGLVFGSIPV